MEALESSSLGAIGSLIKKLNKMPFTEEDGPQQLGNDIAIIRTRLEELSMVYDPPQTVKYWTKDARELSYNMEDYIDQSDSKIAWTDLRSEFEDLVEEAIDRYNRYQLDEYLVRSANNTVGRLHFGAAAHWEPEHVIPVGMEEQMNMLLGWVNPKEDRPEDLQLKVVSILGVEGIGKSTLAIKLWRESDGKFQCRAFVQAAKKPDISLILRNIFLQVHPDQEAAEACNLQNLIHDLREYLKDKRYLIVIDDLWALSVWDIVRRAFPESGNCCRIVTVTTVEDVAQACSNYDPSNIIYIKPLSDDQSRRLFVNRLFGSRNDCPEQLIGVSDEITSKCGGLPLAIICIATIIAQPRQLDNAKKEHQLECEEEIGQQLGYVKNILCRKNLSMEIMTEVLKLCYSGLPDCLKTCLLYLCVYPENYLIVKEDLVAQWIAEGFISTSDGKDIDEVASIYFDWLVDLRLIQRRDISNSYTVHPLVFDFIRCKSMEDNFITTIDYSQSMLVLTDNVRRLALHFGSATYASIPESTVLSHVRSFSYVGLLSCMPPLLEFKLVRVMILHVQGGDDNAMFPLAEISELLLLRYLQVRCEPIRNTITFSEGKFPALEYFKLVSSTLKTLTFMEKAMPNLRALKIRFSASRGMTDIPVLDGVEHLLNIQEVDVDITAANSAEESDKIALESALEDAFRMHPRPPIFNKKKLQQAGEECPPPVTSQVPNIPLHFSIKPINIHEKQGVVHNEDSTSEQPRCVDKMPKKDMNRCSSVWTAVYASVKLGRSRYWAKNKLQHTSVTPRHLTFKLLQDITNNFSVDLLVGSGRYGKVYKGVLNTGEEIAVKKLYDMPGLNNVEFKKEFNNLMRVKHQNIIRLVGYCYEIPHKPVKNNIFAQTIERALCFEYLQSGSLDKHLSDESCGLDWDTRFKIITGICEGLNYLHNESQNHIYHLELKPSNILLDKNMMPKIEDFGLSKLFQKPQTFPAKNNIETPYVPPEYIEDSKKNDVFSLGVIIIEIMAGPSGHSKYTEMSPQQFAELVRENWMKRFHATSRHTSYESDSLEVNMCIQMALGCVAADRGKRPTMAQVINQLNKIETRKRSHGQIPHQMIRRYNKRPSMWNHFTLTDHDGQKFRKAKCIHCGKELKIDPKLGMSHLHRHISSKQCSSNVPENQGDEKMGCIEHPSRPPPVQTQAPIASDSSSSSTVDFEPAGPGGTAAAVLPVTPSSDGQSDMEAVDLLARMIALGGYDPAIVDNDCFRFFVASLRPEFKLPSRNEVENLGSHIFQDEMLHALWWDYWINDDSKRGRISLAVGKAKVFDREVIYVAYHCIDNEWSLRMMVQDAWTSPVCSEACADIGLTMIDSGMKQYEVDTTSLFTVAWVITDDLSKVKDWLSNADASKRKLFCTTMDYVLQSVAEHLYRNVDAKFIGDVYTSIGSVYSREEQMELLKYVGSDPWPCTEAWYSWYCFLSMAGQADTFAEENSEFRELLRRILEEIYHAIKTISASSGPMANLCFLELLSVRNFLQSEIALASGGGHTNLDEGRTGFVDNKDVATVLTELTEILDKAIRESYLAWSIPIVLDPRYKLNSIESMFQKASGDHFSDLISSVKTNVKELYFEYQQGKGQTELDDYLADSVITPTEPFDILRWWKVHGCNQYPKLALMARDALAIPTCSQLSSDQIVELKGILRGYRQAAEI